MMKFNVFFAIAVLFISCTNEKKQTEQPKQTAKITSDVLLEQHAKSPFGPTDTHKGKEYTLTISGKTVLGGTATIKILDTEGKEVSCRTFPAKELIHDEYKTANSALQEAHIREVVKNYFEQNEDLAFLQ